MTLYTAPSTSLIIPVHLQAAFISTASPVNDNDNCNTSPNNTSPIPVVYLLNGKWYEALVPNLDMLTAFPHPWYLHVHKLNSPGASYTTEIQWGPEHEFDDLTPADKLFINEAVSKQWQSIYKHTLDACKPCVPVLA